MASDTDTTNGVSLSRGPWKVHVKGAAAIAALLVVVVAYAVWREVDRITQASAAEHAQIVAAQTALAKEFEVLSYLLSLPIEERPRLLPPAGLEQRLERVPMGRRSR